MNSNNVSDHMNINKSYIDTMNAIYCLNTFDKEKIDQIFLDIKNKIIETKILTPEKVLIILNNASMFRNRYLKSYIYIFKRIYYEYIPKPMKEVREIYNYLLYKEYEIIYDDKHQENFKKYEEQNYSWDVHKKDTIFWAIMNDDKKLFEEFLARDDFNASIMIYNELYPFPQQSLISLCCYHGAAECFKLLRDKCDPEITADCLQLSFYGGDIDIINECLKHQKLEQQHMRDLIFMHHNDFLNLFLPEFDLSKPYLLENYLLTCTQYNNLEAFISYLYKSNDINTCFIYSSAFNLPSLCEYLIKNGADINAKDKKQTTALHIAAMYNCKQAAEVLISHGIDINASDITHKTALHYAVFRNCQETAELLIYSRANTNIRDNSGRIALHMAAIFDFKKIADLLVLNYSEIDMRDNNGKTPLHVAAEHNSFQTVSYLISRGANVNKIDDNKRTPLHYAAEMDSYEAAKILLTHGADSTIIDKDDQSPLDVAVFYEKEKTAELLLLNTETQSNIQVIN